MARHNKNINTCQAAIAEINRSVNAVTAEICARTGAANDAKTIKRSRRLNRSGESGDFLI